MAIRKYVVKADGTTEYVDMDAAEETAFESARQPRTLTAEELDALKDRQIDRLDIALLRIGFNHENRLRVLEAKPAITIEQFKAALKALLT